MTLYEYRCPNGHVFELFQTMGAPAPDGCEVCGAAPLERVLYPVAVHFKGSGFYATDYGRSGRKGQDSSGGGGKDGDSGSGSSDSSGNNGGEKVEKKEKAAEA